MSPKPPIVEPIQQSSVSQPAGSGGAAPINPSPVVEEGPASGNVPPSQAAQFDRPGTQDALRGQGNSAAPKEGITREQQAPVAREQRKAAEFGNRFGVGSAADFVTSEAKEGEPRVGKVRGDGNSDANLVEAGTTMAGDAGADTGTNSADQEEGTEGGMRAMMEPKPKL